jgi:hypothetical protein
MRRPAAEGGERRSRGRHGRTPPRALARAHTIGGQDARTHVAACRSVDHRIGVFRHGTGVEKRRKQRYDDICSWLSLTASAVEFEAPVSCRAEMTLSLFSRGIPKSIGASMGTMSGSILSRESCTGGTATLLEEGRQIWSVTYQGFGGTLPAISRVNTDVGTISLLGSASGGLARCLYFGTIRIELSVEGGGRITSFRIEEVASSFGLATRLAGSLFCPVTIRLRGTSGVPAPATRMTLL